MTTKKRSSPVDGRSKILIGVLFTRISLQRIGGVLMGDEAGGAVRPWPPSRTPG